MIFLSHNFKDKVIVEQIAKRLAEGFSRDEIFYDSWSIQPGEGIIDKMNEGLENCKLFLFFVSKNSLQSKMVALEWQNALLKSTKGGTKIIPVKLDDCLMPPILLQTLYIDLFGQGLEVALRQIVDVASGQNTFSAGGQEFSNLRAYATEKENGLVVVECKAEHYMEAISNYLFLFDNGEDELDIKCLSHPMHTRNYASEIQINNVLLSGWYISISTPTTPGFSFVIEFSPKPGFTAKLKAALHEKSRGQWREIPLSFLKK